MYVLVMALMFGSGGAAIESAEFDNKAACELAKKAFDQTFEKSKGGNAHVAYCVPKS